MTKYVDLPKEIESKLECEYGAALRAMKIANGEAAVNHARAAWSLLPEPRRQWSMSFLAATLLIKSLRIARRFDEAAKFAGESADQTIEVAERPIFLVYRGASLLDMGEADAAYDAFAEAWGLAREFPFEGQDKKYLEFFRKRAKGAKGDRGG